ncbi:Scramblase-domain-containing protein [Agrocybe pediades]|nr:Scramblase-domain-containing protein [Agrocybe pediades]
MSLSLATRSTLNTLIKHGTGSSRVYSISRFPPKSTGVGRSLRRQQPLRTHLKKKDVDDNGHETTLGCAETDFNGPEIIPPYWNSHEDGLKAILRENTLVIERQLEMLNVFIGFEQSNKYTISNENGAILGYIAEEPRGFMGTISRQFLRTHRPFSAVVMDDQGTPILWLRRPFSWINSRMYVQRAKTQSILTRSIEPELDIFGEVQQIWHPWRRRYDLFLREKQELLDGHGEGTSSNLETFYQIGKVDAGFLSWTFNVTEERGQVMAKIERAFRGFGREIFTDTGRYVLSFKPAAMSIEHPISDSVEENQYINSIIRGELDLDSKALLLSLAINIDFDYFSRHSHAGGGGLFGFHTSSWD